MRSKIVPAAKVKPATVSHKTISAVVGLWSRPLDEPPCTKKRFGQVAPGTEQYHWSQTTNSLASALRTGSCSGAKRRMRRPGSACPPFAAYEATYPLLSIGG